MLGSDGQELHVPPRGSDMCPNTDNKSSRDIISGCAADDRPTSDTS